MANSGDCRWSSILKVLSTATQEARINRGTVSDCPPFELHFFHSEKWLDRARAGCLVFLFSVLELISCVPFNNHEFGIRPLDRHVADVHHFGTFFNSNAGFLFLVATKMVTR
jgi:hypothetical protein